jgi:hypothetical protein
MADELLEKLDLFALPVDVSGWLLKESRSNPLLGKRWQKRFFVLQSVSSNMFAKDASVHSSATSSMKIFVLTYFESEESSRKQNASKALVVDPSIAVVRDPSQDKPGRVCIKFVEAATKSCFVLGASSGDEAVTWMSKVNKAYENAGFTPVGMPGGGGKLQRTLTDMERTDPNTAITQDGEVVPMPTGGFRNGVFSGPCQFKRTASGSLAVIGGGWKLTNEQLVEREMRTLVGLPKPGQVFSDLQADSCQVPRGSVLIV